MDNSAKTSSELPPSKLEKLEKFKQDLPITPLKGKFLEAYDQNLTLVVVGETGSGKTTQIPQYILEKSFSETPASSDLEAGKRISRTCVTQPRRIAAITVSQRVSFETGYRLGNEIGYKIRFEEKCSSNTRLRYVTDGILLREMCSDPTLSNYDCVIIDEAHERTLDTDVLLGLVKLAQKLRNSTEDKLRLIIMSATLNVEKFSDFFGNCPIFAIPGRNFPVTIHHHAHYNLDELKSRYVTRAVDVALEVHRDSPPGDMLVFLTGQQEIRRAIHQFEEGLQGNEVMPAKVVPIYAALEQIDQRQAFDPAPPGYRKVVFATNIAQTSITIPNISYVVDPGFVKQKTFDNETGMDGLIVVPISQAAAIQRAGRAGRTQEGQVYRLYRRVDFEQKMSSETVPEIQRSSLLSTCLAMKALNIVDVIGFDFLDPPSHSHLQAAIKKLVQLHALDQTKDNQITSLGRQMARLPLAPSLACSLIHSSRLQCSRDFLSIAAMLSVEDPISQSKSEEGQALQRRIFSAKFADPSGDHLTLYNIYQAAKLHDFKKDWCYNNYINYRVISKAKEIHLQLAQIMEEMKLNLISLPTVTKSASIPSQRFDQKPILKALCLGYFLNFARRHPQGRSFCHYPSTSTLLALQLHPTSVFNMRCPYTVTSPSTNIDWIIYSQILYTTQCQLRHVSSVDPEWVMPLLTIETSQEAVSDPLKSASPSLSITASSKNRLEQIEAARERYLARTTKRPRT